MVERWWYRWWNGDVTVMSRDGEYPVCTPRGATQSNRRLECSGSYVGLLHEDRRRLLQKHEVRVVVRLRKNGEGALVLPSVERVAHLLLQPLPFGVGRDIVDDMHEHRVEDGL